MVEEKPHPVKKGDWVESRHGDARVGIVRSGHWHEGHGDAGPTFTIDVVLYDHSGRKIGRESPVLGGPRGFEPCLDYADWQRIERPSFPVEIRWMPGQDGSLRARRATLAATLPDRTHVPVPRKAAREAPPVEAKPKTDFDPELEVRSRRMAAQQLRDLFRTTQVEELRGRAEALEVEASRIAVEHGLER